MAVSFKLNNADFLHHLFLLPLSLFHPSLLHHHLSLLASLFPQSINTRSFAIATNTPISSVPRILQDYFFPKIIINPSKSPTSNLACNIPIKQIHRSICKSVQSFQPVVVNVNAV